MFAEGNTFTVKWEKKARIILYYNKMIAGCDQMAPFIQEAQNALQTFTDLELMHNLLKSIRILQMIQ